MGRPKKLEPEAIIDETPDKLKACPKCDAPGKAPYKDMHSNWRCSCPECNFWDSQVYHSAREAARGWNLAGGPARPL